MKIVTKVAIFLARVFAGISMLALLVMLLITLADVFLRFFFRSPIVGTVEIARMMMICMVPAFVLALFEKRHLAVEFIIEKFGRKGQLVFDTFGYIVSAIIVGLMCYQGFQDMFRVIDQNRLYSQLYFPTWPFYCVYAVSMGFFALAMLICLVNNFLNKDLYLEKPVKVDVEDVIV